jgi:hypothetical protein
VLPCNVEVDLRDRHVLVQFDHVGTFVVVGSAEEEGEELHHGGVQFGDVADILEEEVVDALVCEDELVELCDHFFELIVSPQLLEES